MLNPLTTRTAKSATTKRSLTLLGVLVVFALAAGYAIAAPRVASPAITSGPSGTTRATSASFSFRGDRGLTFECALDGTSFRACTSPKAYSGLAAGSHTFEVRARDARGQLSSPTSRSWTIDTAAPTISLQQPQDGQLYGWLRWEAGCSGAFRLCGSASDASDVASVSFSLRRNADGRWWSGSSFSATRETFVVARGDTSWRYALPTPADGSYTLRVRATDALGNATASGAERTATFQLKLQRPPVPRFVSTPSDPSSSSSATFALADDEPSVTFQCRLDHQSSYEPCNANPTFDDLEDGRRTLSVRVLDAAGNYSDPVRYSWTIDTSLPPTVGEDFTVSGGYSALLTPGASGPLALTIANPNDEPIFVTRLTVTIQPGSTRAGCDGPANLSVTPSDVSEANPLTVPANGSVTLPSGGVSAPQIEMLDLPTNQDACKGALFTFAYGGSAHS